MQIEPYGLCGEPARLIPVGPDSQKERKATSAFLANLQAVDEFGRDLLSSIGAKASKKSKVACYTEVHHRGKKLESNQRPDGLIVVSYGQRAWAAFVEAKIGADQLSSEQVEGYLDLARDCGIDAVITISNQFVPDPTHSPVAVHGAKLRSVGLFHWSWRYVISKAMLAHKNQEISDPDQAYMLSEFVRYLEHESSGVRSFTHMGPHWKQVCLGFHQGKTLLKNSESAIDTTTNWLQLVRFLSLEMSLAVGKPVSIYLTPKQRKNPGLIHTDALEELATQGIITAGFEIPNAASVLWLRLDFNRRKLLAWMSLDAPSDKKQPKAAVTWLLRQLGQVEQENLLVHAFWPYKSSPGIARLIDVQATPDRLLEFNVGVIPKKFDIVWTEDLAGDIGKSRVFVDAAEGLLLGFYRQIGQNLKPWIAPPPRVRDDDEKESQPAAQNDDKPPPLALVSDAVPESSKIALDLIPLKPDELRESAETDENDQEEAAG
jgi:hypothetical protein